MQGISKVLYQIFLKLYYIGAVFLSPFNAKAAKWLSGRKHTLEWLDEFGPAMPTIWIHCASLGEYEQADPVIKGLSKSYPNYHIILTFFSPSGYEIVSKKNLGISVFYLPQDSKRNAEKFIRILKPALAIFVKYDLWYYYLTTIKENDIPAVLISAVFHGNDIFFKRYGGLFKEMLACLSLILVQDDRSAKVLKKNGIEHYKVTGDTRLDRVVEIRQKNREVPFLSSFKGVSRIFIAGSTEPKDIPFIEKFVADFKDASGLKIVIAPHDVSEASVLQLGKKLKIASSVRYSQASDDNIKNALVLIIDNIGWLSSIYRYCEFAYIGGGFDRGIHNILEPVVFGIPVFFGPKYEKFNEAKYLVSNGGAFPIKDYSQLKEKFSQLFDQPESYRIASQKAQDYVNSQQGATEKTLKFIEKLTTRS